MTPIRSIRGFKPMRLPRTLGLLAATLSPICLWGDPSIVGASELSRESGAPTANAHFQYTPPVPLSRLANEWEPQQALILSLSFTEAMEDLEIARNFVSVLEAAHPYLDIYVFGDQEKHRQYAHFLSLIKHHPKIEAIASKTRFIDSRSILRWTRDFGPLFGIGTDDQLVVIDMVYRDLMKPLEEGALQLGEPLDPLRDFFNLNGDAMPSELAALLQTEYETAIDIARPPVSMDGGDFVSDGRGNVFISRQTLVRNGGNRSELERVFQRYFGASKLHVLEALPGRTVPHLDMILKFLDSETIVVPDLKRSFDEPVNAYHADLNRKAREALEKNERYLRREFPKHTISKMPMPPILFKSRAEIAAEATQTFVKAIALDKGIATADSLKRVDSSQMATLERRVLAEIRKEIPSADFTNTASFDAILRQYGQLPLDAFIERYSEPTTRYRSYINSVFLHTHDGRQAFLAPRFTSSHSEEDAALKTWEAEVEKIYRSAWPDAAIHWINCDSMVADLGFLHCATLTVPLIEKN